MRAQTDTSARLDPAAPPDPRFLTLWAINSALDLPEASRQLDAFVEAGLDGVVVHPRNYPDTPRYLSEEYLRQLSMVIEEAKRRDLAVWIYDENGWPSGSAGGRMLEAHPEVAQQWLEFLPSNRLRPDDRVFGRYEDRGQAYAAVLRHGDGVDYLGADIGADFVELTHEVYRSGLSAEAWAHVEAFFDDEPEFGLGHSYPELPAQGAIPWTEDLPERFAERYGEQLEPVLPRIFLDGPDSGLVRVRFWELVSDLLKDRFLAPIDAWCKRHGKRFTAHVKGEESPYFQVPMVGSGQWILRGVNLPGVDALGRDPSNDFYPRQAASIARQFGDGRSMAEAFGGAGWGAGPADLHRYLLWLAQNGLTDFVLHLSQYRLDSAAIADWPPSQPLHVTWSAAYSALLGKVRADIRGLDRSAPDLLVVIPQRRVMGLYAPRELKQTNIHDGSTRPNSAAAQVSSRFIGLIADLVAAGVRFDVTDERTLERDLECARDGAHVGAAVYRSVIVSPDADLDPHVRQRLTRYLRSIPERTHLTETAPVRIAPEAARSLGATWTVREDQINHLLLEPIRTGEGWSAPLRIDGGFDGDLMLEFADDITAASIGSTPLPVRPGVHGSRALVPAALLAERNRVAFTLTRATSGVVPFVWVSGRFRVRSKSAWNRGLDGQLHTAGPFVINGRSAGPIIELVQDGFPFLGSALILDGTVMISEPLVDARLTGLAALTARLSVGGTEQPWVWDGAESDSTVRLASGLHDVTMEVLPNGFNFYGPHHYFLGDHHVVSPKQVEGRKNFADPAGAPEVTHTAEIWFRDSVLPGVQATSAGPAGPRTTKRSERWPSL